MDIEREVEFIPKCGICKKVPKDEIYETKDGGYICKDCLDLIMELSKLFGEEFVKKAKDILSDKSYQQYTVDEL